MELQELPPREAHGAFVGVFGVWFCSIVAFTFSALKFEDGIIGALVLLSLSTGILSSFLLQYLSKNRRGRKIPLLLLIFNAGATCVLVYVLIGLMI
ncbi:Uncharacterised protein [Corynebacterium kutscheri]|uniref:Uncharacterized protein n=1 Tax=Corynebacterium kutscheri TaxID=35755 RepID=A0A0F6R0S0_9CORY|nr:hypothetical protein [Corynebacterium kutscheri]AKE41872.1 hypothetical protein UL82_08580 [Corynebacterium kutscheri]VEH04393.1 Uncharacterised protein [Corynebacterium kutscheri]VEH10200.1 Uncharacterised protein [Corynebacterium kutscheri]VEH80282.1 Uncharacterised protein [Corynebacterium kutscheri]